jgi:hypothetical protein
MKVKITPKKSEGRLTKLDDVGALNLSYAILSQAKRDYRVVMRHGDQVGFNRYELERFFKSNMFEYMIGSVITPDDFMKRVRTLPADPKDENRMEVVSW